MNLCKQGRIVCVIIILRCDVYRYKCNIWFRYISIVILPSPALKSTDVEILDLAKLNYSISAGFIFLDDISYILL